MKEGKLPPHLLWLWPSHTKSTHRSTMKGGKTIRRRYARKEEGEERVGCREEDNGGRCASGKEREREGHGGGLPPSLPLTRTTTTGVIATVRDRFPLPPTYPKEEGVRAPWPWTEGTETHYSGCLPPLSFRPHLIAFPPRNKIDLRGFIPQLLPLRLRPFHFPLSSPSEE